MKVKFDCKHVVETAVKFRSTKLCPNCRVLTQIVHTVVVLFDGKNPAVLDLANNSVVIDVGHKHFITIDAADWDLVRVHRWHSFAPAEHLWYAQAKIDGKPVTLHRLLLNAPADKMVDHINRYTGDCRRCNLRLATPSQSAANRNVPTNNPYIGVNLVGKRYTASVTRNCKRIYIGTYDTAIEAAKARDAAAKALYGGYTRLNFPEAMI